METIETMITAFCDRKLNDAYKKLCLKALRRLKPTTGTPHMWAAGIVYAIAQTNGLIGNQYDLIFGKPKLHLTADEVAAAFGVSKGGMSGKAKHIRDTLHITPNQKEWMSPERLEGAKLKAQFLRLMRMK